ncbi:MAG: hypothetical protein ACXVVQ_17920, partial [Solirubrobacteraceae bacterium]
MKLCPRCATENADGTDFCVVCGEYLRWEPTRAVQALTPADVSGAPAAETPSESAAAKPASSSPAPIVDPNVTLPPGAAAVAPVAPVAPQAPAQAPPPDAATLLLRL